MSINYGRKALRLVLFPSIFILASWITQHSASMSILGTVYLHMYMQEFAIPNTGRQVGVLKIEDKSTCFTGAESPIQIPNVQEGA